MLSGMSTIEIIENLKIENCPKIGWYDGSDDRRRLIYRLLVNTSWKSRLDEIQDFVFLSSHPHQVDLTRFRPLVFLSSRPEEVDLTRFRIFSSCLLVLTKWTWRDSGSFLLVFSSWRSRLDEIHDLFFSSSPPDEVDLTRFRILSSCFLILIESTRRDPGSCLLVFSSWRSWLDEIEDLVFLSSCLVFLSSWLIFSSSRLRSLWFISSSGGTSKLP